MAGPDSRESLIRDITALRNSFAKRRRALAADEAEVTELFQKRCGDLGHKFEWHQVAGDGKYCTICGLHDCSDD